MSHSDVTPPEQQDPQRHLVRTIRDATAVRLLTLVKHPSIDNMGDINSLLHGLTSLSLADLTPTGAVDIALSGLALASEGARIAEYYSANALQGQFEAQGQNWLLQLSMRLSTLLEEDGHTGDDALHNLSGFLMYPILVERAKSFSPSTRAWATAAGLAIARTRLSVPTGWRCIGCFVAINTGIALDLPDLVLHARDSAGIEQLPDVFRAWARLEVYRTDFLAWSADEVKQDIDIAAECIARYQRPELTRGNFLRGFSGVIIDLLPTQIKLANKLLDDYRSHGSSDATDRMEWLERESDRSIDTDEGLSGQANS